jgi:lysophospholipase L1-like esterase
MHAPEQIAKVLSFDPTAVLVMGGTNDLAANTESALEGALVHLAGIASTLAEHTGAKVIVSTVSPSTGKARVLTERFNAQILKNGIEDAEVTNAAAIVLSQDLGPDGIHPNLQGYERLGHALARAAVYEPGGFLFAAIPFAFALGALGTKAMVG